MRRRRDPDIGKPQPVVRAPALRLRSKTGAMERAIHKVAGTVAGEHASGSIGAMRGRSQTENQQAGRWIAERRHRFTPVVPVQIRPSLVAGNLLTVGDQAGTPDTRYNLPIQRDKVSVVRFFRIGWMH